MGDESTIKKKTVDVLHPLSRIKWDKRGSLPAALPESIQVILVKDCLCIGTEYTVYLSSSDLKSWKTMVTRAHDFALACFDSKILTIGGLDSACAREITGRSWVVDVVAQTYESSSLPPLLVERHSACAVNVESAQCMVVAGGANDKEVLDSVEVLLNGRWGFVQSLPSPEFGLRVAVHNGVLYFTRNSLAHVFSCDVARLLRARETSESELWNVFSSSQSHKSPVSFGNHFCMVGSNEGSPAAEIQVMSDLEPDRKWVVLARAPDSVVNRASVVLPNGGMLMLGRESGDIYRGVLNMTSFSSNGKFSEHALSKLEEQGIPVLKVMEKKVGRVREVLQLEEEVEEDDGEGNDSCDRLVAASFDNGCLDTMLKSWVSGKGSHPPTWRSLLELLQQIKEEKLSQQIESYFQTSSIANTSRSVKRPQSLAASKIIPPPSRSSSRLRESLSGQPKEKLCSSQRKMPTLKMREIPSLQKKRASLLKEKKQALCLKEQSISPKMEQPLSLKEQSLSPKKEQPLSLKEQSLSPQKEQPLSLKELSLSPRKEQSQEEHNLSMEVEQPVSQKRNQPLAQEELEKQPLLQENQQPSFLLKELPLQGNEPACVVRKRPLSQENEQLTIKKRPSSQKFKLPTSQPLIEQLSSQDIELPSQINELSRLKSDSASASPAATPRRSARLRNRPNRYGTPFHS